MGFDIDVSGAEAAITAAGGIDHLIQGGEGPASPAPPAAEPQTPTPQGATPEAPSATPGVTPELDAQAVEAARQYIRDKGGRFASPEGGEQGGGDTGASFMGENFDPNSLPPELIPAYRQMQGHFTKVTQEASPWRKLAEESGIEDPTELHQVVQLREMLQDPSTWVALHQELSQGLENMGLSPAEASAQASAAIQQEAGTAAGGTPDLSQLAAAEPELAPFAQAYDGLRSELTQMREELQQEREAAQQESFKLAFLGEMQRQENALRTAHPELDDNAVAFLYELSTAHDGNLIRAYDRFEELQSGWAENYLGSKTPVRPVPPATPTMGTVEAPVAAQQGGEPKTLDDAHKEAMEYLRLQGLLDD